MFYTLISKHSFNFKISKRKEELQFFTKSENIKSIFLKRETFCNKNVK